MPRGLGYGLYGPRGVNDRRDDRRMPRGYLMRPGVVPGGLNPRNANPMFANPRMNPMILGQGQASPPSMDEVKKWVMETCGSLLQEATGSLKIRGFPDDTPQFIVHKPEMQLQTAFEQRKSRLGSSKLVFHGTPLPNLQPILQGGFKGGRDGAVWVAKDPLTSVGYALKGRMGGGRRMFYGAGGFGAANTPQSLYFSYGALLGCEFVDDRRFRKGFIVELDETTCTSDRHAIMVRYVFLVPPGIMNEMAMLGRGGFTGQMGAAAFPRRFQIRDQMKENMEKIEAMIEEKRREG